MEQQKADFERAKQSLRIMQAALDKAKSEHGNLYTFGDCASIYASIMNLNNFIDKYGNTPEQRTTVQQPQQTTVQQPNQPFLTLNKPQTINYQTS